MSAGFDLDQKLYKPERLAGLIKAFCTFGRHPATIVSKSQKLSQKMIAAFCKDTGAKNRDVIYTDSMSGINWSTIPVTIIELGFMSNPSEDRLMATESYRDKMAQGIADGIDAYYE